MFRALFLALLGVGVVWSWLPSPTAVLRPAPTAQKEVQLLVHKQQIEWQRHPQDPAAATALADSLLTLQAEAHALRVLSAVPPETRTARMQVLLAAGYAQLGALDEAHAYQKIGVQLCQAHQRCTSDDAVRLRLLQERMAGPADAPMEGFVTFVLPPAAPESP